MDDRQRFDRLISVILDHEGGYVCDPVDPGGETKYGICKRSYPHLNIKALTIKEACDIYYRDWWLRLKCDLILSDLVAQKLLDTCVNVGAGTGVKLLQQALCDCGCRVAIDGRIGPQTIGAVNSVQPDKLLIAMRTRQAEHYRQLIAKNPSLAQFEHGWMRRAAS